MKLKSSIGNIGRQNQRLKWPFKTVEAGGLTWGVITGHDTASFSTNLKSKQHISVRFFQGDPEAPSTIPSTLMILLSDNLIVANTVNTNQIPAGAIRDAVEDLVLKLTPVAEKLWADEVAYVKRENAKYSRTVSARQTRADRAEAIRKANEAR